MPTVLPARVHVCVCVCYVRICESMIIIAESGRDGRTRTDTDLYTYTAPLQCRGWMRIDAGGRMVMRFDSKVPVEDEEANREISDHV